MKLCVEFGKKYFEVEIDEKDYNYIYETIEHYYTNRIYEIIHNNDDKLDIIDELYKNFSFVQHMLYGYFDCLAKHGIISQFDNTILSSVIIDELLEYHSNVVNDLE